MKKYSHPEKDPVLKNILQDIDVPQLSVDFSAKVMTSIHSYSNASNRASFKVPVGIKVGIPVFMAICALMIIIFPGNQSSGIEQFINNIPEPGFFTFFERISHELQSFRLPEINISKEFLLYFGGGVGLLLMFIFSEGISQRMRKS